VRLALWGDEHVICATCGRENAPGRNFCGECGAPLAEVCPACGFANDESEKFCGKCGARLRPADAGAASLAAGPAAPSIEAPQVSSSVVAELRLVSVLFLDLVGFTALSESRDPEEVRDLLSRYFDVCRGLIERYGGTVEKFIGDAVMAVWGAPVATEDDAERAVRAALDLVVAVAALGVEVGATDLQARAGVLTGEAAVTVGATGQGMVMGDLVNTASRLQSVAEPGAVLVGEATVRAASQAVAFTPLGAVALKGKEEPVPIWQADRVVAQRRGVGRSERVEPPFVGRGEELRLLKDLLHATAREQRVRLVSVTGIAGIGKSRLAWEFLKYVDGLASTVYWHRGRSPAYGEGITFWALGEMVRMRAGISDADDPSQARAKLAASVAEFVLDPDERRWVEQGLAHLLGLAEAPGGDREELFSSWRTFFERIADRGPTVLVFEDLQWADSGLIDFIESIVEWSRTRPILVLTQARPELLDRRPSWGAGQRTFSALHLEPLEPSAMAALLRGFVAGLPEAVVQQVLQRAEGVPLYAVETIRMLVDRGQLVESDGVLAVSGQLGILEIPDTLHALIASRLDAVPAEERALLQDAAVLGQSFSAAALAEVTGRDAAGLAGPLRDLVRRELLAINADPRSPERGQYGFVQGLIREVAYGTLAKPDRRARHLAAAQYFEGLGDEELVGVVATHYTEAHRASPDGPERDALASRARGWLIQGGRRALDLGSPEQSLLYLEQALALTDEPSERAELLDLAGEAATRANDSEAAAGHLEAAISAHLEANEAEASGTSTARLAQALAGLGQFAVAIARAERALSDLGESAGERTRADIAATISGLASASGAWEPALAWAEMACIMAERLDDPSLLALAISTRAHAIFSLGRHQEAVMLARGSVALTEAAGSLLEQGDAHLMLSVYLLDDDPRQSLSLSFEAADLGRRAGHRGLETMNLLNGAELAIWLGQWGEARSSLTVLAQRELAGERGAQLAFCEATLAALSGNPAQAEAQLQAHSYAAGGEGVTIRSYYGVTQAVAHLAAGELEAAHRDATKAVLVDPSGINSARALALQLRSALWLGDAGRAREAVTGMQGIRGRWMAAARLTGEAGIAALEGRDDDAAHGYVRAMDAWRALDCPLDLALCALDRAVLRGSAPDQADEDEEARAILSEIGAYPFLARLDRASPVARAAG
jgi:class 3 adenylate cyclase/tetratricopeptide (TPR) repeat protein